MFAGVLLVFVGIVFLLQNLGYISGNVWEVIWPIIIVMAGLSLIFRRTSTKELFKKFKKK